MKRWSTVALLLWGCSDRVGDIDWSGNRWNAEGQCWESAVAFQAQPVCDALQVLVRDPSGVCWSFGCYPIFPEGWHTQEFGCDEVPEEDWFAGELCPADG